MRGKSDDRAHCLLAEAARRSIHQRRITGSTPEHQRAVVHSLWIALTSGRVTEVIAVLSPTAEMITDNGGVVARTLRGATDVALRLCDLPPGEPTEIAEHEVNGRAGLVLRRHGFVVGVICIDVTGDQVSDLWMVLNPTKLRHWN